MKTYYTNFFRIKLSDVFKTFFFEEYKDFFERCGGKYSDKLTEELTINFFDTELIKELLGDEYKHVEFYKFFYLNFVNNNIILYYDTENSMKKSLNSFMYDYDFRFDCKCQENYQNIVGNNCKCVDTDMNNCICKKLHYDKSVNLNSISPDITLNFKKYINKSLSYIENINTKYINIENSLSYILINKKLDSNFILKC